MRKYKHKITDDVATFVREGWYIYGGSCHIAARLIENSNDWEEVIEKDYEIQSFISNAEVCAAIPKGTIVIRRGEDFISGCIRDTEENLLLLPKWDIHSIKRLSDGEIFTVGDKIDGATYTDRTLLFFSLDRYGKSLLIKQDCGDSELNWIKHSKPTPLFTTEDGVEIREGDDYYWVNPKTFNWSIRVPGNYLYNNPPTKRELQFSTKKAAQKYIDDNKPIYSKKQAIEMLKALDAGINEYTGKDEDYNYYLL